MRIGPNTVSVNSEQGLHKIFSGSSPIEKSPFYKAFAPGFPSSFAAVGDAFKQKKSILSHAFAQKKLDAMEVTFMEHTMKLYEAMVAQKVVDLDQALSALTIDILSDVCFGETFDLIHNPAEKARVSDGLVQAAKWVSLVSSAPKRPPGAAASLRPHHGSKLIPALTTGRDNLEMAIAAKDSQSTVQ